MYFTYEEIDRTIFELIRLEIVRLGFLPDVTSYLTDNAAYQVAKNNLRNTLDDKQLIDIFGVGTTDARDEKTVNKITVRRKEAPKGTLGGFPVVEYDPITVGNTVTGFNKFKMPEHTKNIKYEIRYISRSVKFARIMSQIIEDTIGVRRYINPVKNDGSFDTVKNFFIEMSNEVDVSDDNVIEYLFTYDVKDVFIQRRRQINTAPIVPLTTVNVKPNAINIEEIESNPNIADQKANFDITPD